MEQKALAHLDERFGHVAIDMGLLTPEQVADIQLRVVLSRTESQRPSSFGAEAIASGFLDAKGLEALEAEEHRRRRLINGYEIIDLLGIGTISTAYHARQLAMDREVALKILHPRLASDPVFVRAYIAEAQAVSQFHHPNIVQGIDAGESNGFYYFAHEYLSGGSLADRLKAGSARFSENRLLMYLRQTNAALKHAWAVAVYHGDINPGNLLLDGRGNIKLANLGVPRVAGMVTRGTRMAPGFIRCGPEYAAPEQVEKPEIVNARTDIYNLGATFYHISFGIPPFRGRGNDELIAYRTSNPMPSFSLKEQEGFSGKYLRLLRDMLEADPNNRPADPEELDARLERFHISDGDELARQVRQVAGPAGKAPASVRVRARSTAPSLAAERRFSLRARTGWIRSPRWLKWLVAALLALAAVVAWYWAFFSA